MNSPSNTQKIQSDLIAALEKANRVLAELSFSAYITGDDYASKDMRQRVKATHIAAYEALAKISA